MTTASETTSAPAPAEPDWAEPPAPPAAAPTAEPVAAAEPEAPAVVDEPESPEDTGWKDPTEGWEHDYLDDFHGDKLAFRVPTEAALSAYGLAAGPGSSAFEQNRYTRKLLQRHLSPLSLERVFDRMLDPDDAEYNDETLGELTQAMSKPLIDRLEAEAEEAKAKAKAAGKGKK